MYKFRFENKFEVYSQLKDLNNQDLIITYKEKNGNIGVVCDESYSIVNTNPSFHFEYDYDREEPGDVISIYNNEFIEKIYVILLDYDNYIKMKIANKSQDTIACECVFKNVSPNLPISQTVWNSDKPIWYVCEISKSDADEYNCIFFNEFLSLEEAVARIPGLELMCCK